MGDIENAVNPSCLPRMRLCSSSNGVWIFRMPLAINQVMSLLVLASNVLVHNDMLDDDNESDEGKKGRECSSEVPRQQS